MPSNGQVILKTTLRIEKTSENRKTCPCRNSPEESSLWKLSLVLTWTWGQAWGWRDSGGAWIGSSSSQQLHHLNQVPTSQALIVVAALSFFFLPSSSSNRNQLIYPALPNWSGCVVLSVTVLWILGPVPLICPQTQWSSHTAEARVTVGSLHLNPCSFHQMSDCRVHPRPETVHLRCRSSVCRSSRADWVCPSEFVPCWGPGVGCICCEFPGTLSTLSPFCFTKEALPGTR